MRFLSRLLLAVCILRSFSIQEVSAQYILQGMPYGDIQKTFGCKQGTADTTFENSDKINAAILNRSNPNIMYIPKGAWELTEPIVIPARSGYTIIGNGPSGDQPDPAYTDVNGAGGLASRLVWRGLSTEDMIENHGVHTIIRGIHFAGRRLTGINPIQTWVYTMTAGSPIKVTTNYGHGLTNGAKVWIASPTGVTGVTNSLGQFWAKTGGSLSAVEFQLYSDSTLTTPVTGAGTYTAASNTVYWYDSKPQAAIHTFQGDSPVPVGKMKVEDCSFFQCSVGLLFGAGMDQAYAMASDFTGAGPSNSHADESELNSLTFHYPYDVAPTQPRTCMYVRGEQALVFKCGYWAINGAPNEVFYFERGGKLDADHISLNGNGTILRIGQKMSPCHGSFRVGFDVDGMSHQAHILKMDTSQIGCDIEMHGDYSPAFNWVADNAGYADIPKPYIDIMGGTHVKLKVRGLLPGCIRLRGHVIGADNDRLAYCELDGCALIGAGYPTALIYTTAGVPSNGPYYLTWKNCYVINGGVYPNGWWCAPIVDGHKTVAGSGDFTGTGSLITDPGADP